MNYPKRLNHTNYLCRICLSQSKSMIHLSFPLDSKRCGSPQIIEVLEKVMSVKLTCENNFPAVMCSMCLGLLKISYDLKLQFENSENILRQHLKDSSDLSLLDGIVETDTNCENLSSELSPVEIIIGPNKYDLKDIVIVEEEKKEQEEFKGFLDNLGKTITAKFINRSNKKHNSKKINEEDPIILIEKVHTKNLENIYVNTFQKSVDKSVENIDKYIIIQDDLFAQNGVNILKKNLNLQEFGLENPTDTDQELFQSALNMQLKCHICKKLYSSRGRLKRHLETCGKIKYQIIEDQKGEPTAITIAPTILGCHICSRTFKEKKFLNYHIKTTHSEEPLKYTCDICGHVSQNRNAYVYHKLTRHGERKYSCDICGKKFFTSSTLKTHTLNHARSTQCVCPVCGKTFHYKGGLFYHMKQHTNERKYCCESCDRKFYTLMALKRHSLTHTGVRPYACKFCEKKFFSTGEVRKHEHLHTGFRPFRCQYCRKGFSSSYNLKVHLLSHPGSFPCKLCNKTFVNVNVLRFHKKLKHSVVEDSDTLYSNDSETTQEYQ